MSMFDLLNEAGFVGYVLLFLSVLSFAIIIEKMFVLRVSRVVPRPQVRLIVEFLSTGNIGDTIEVCKRNKNLLSEIMIETFRSVGDMSRNAFLSAFEVNARRKIMELERGLSLLATIAAISPLLGLTGTVIGMIKIFGVLNVTSSVVSSPQQLSGGVAQALLTTVFGLFVAIPSVVMFNMFQRKVDRIASEFEVMGVLIANNFKGLK